MENLATLKSLLNKEDYMINLDLTDAYLTVPIHPDSQRFLRFLFGDKTYEFTAMPFGLNVAPMQAVYENHEAGCSLTEESRGSSDHLSRRHFNYSFFNRDVESPQNTSHQLARIPRFSNKLREVESNSIPNIVFLGMLVDSYSYYPNRNLYRFKKNVAFF